MHVYFCEASPGDKLSIVEEIFGHFQQLLDMKRYEILRQKYKPIWVNKELIISVE